ncbi:hypothetical protein [Streptomyces sp. NBC_01180]|uniref:hypothetical protein n=1 Tax=Streptomyces sp. NBC_01180 TaxID=2903763 RepID=UPI00386A0735|nr:hypothetical protein OG708_17820 [Streptomyces sp. NBC_01180]
MPFVPQDLLDRISTLEREVRQLRGRAQIRPALNEVNNGLVAIGEGGGLTVDAPGGARILGVGRFQNGNYGLSSARDDGSGLALTIGGNSADVKQMIRIQARGSGETIVMDDAYADGFLGRPSIPIPMQATSGQTSASTTLSVAFTGASRLMNAVLYGSFETYTPAGVTADVQFSDSDGVVDSWVASKSGGGWTTHEFTKPVRQAFMTHVNYTLRHAVRTGSGSIMTNCLGCYTRNTFTADEAP